MRAEMPSGRSALHPLWPEARWNVSGLFVRGQLIYDLKGLLADRFSCHLGIENVHGAPAVPWNAGRVSRVPVRFDALRKTIRMFNDADVGVFYTFSNHLLEEEDLAEPTCNRMLQMLDNGRGLNGVILASELLYDHVRREHPDLTLTASIVKVTVEDGKGKPDYYKGLGERFESVMVHPDDGFNYDVLDQLDRERVEILVNEDCGLNCEHRKTHYEAMARQQKEAFYSRERNTSQAWHEAMRCRAPSRLQDRPRRTCNMTREELKRVYDMGFRRFKLQGRCLHPMGFLFDLVRYALEPDLVLPVVFKLVSGGWAGERAGAPVRSDRA